MCHRPFFRTILQNIEYVKTQCIDINDPFHFARRRWILGNKSS